MIAWWPISVVVGGVNGSWCDSFAQDCRMGSLGNCASCGRDHEPMVEREGRWWWWLSTLVAWGIGSGWCSSNMIYERNKALHCLEADCLSCLFLGGECWKQVLWTHLYMRKEGGSRSRVSKVNGRSGSGNHWLKAGAIEILSITPHQRFAWIRFNAAFRGIVYCARM